LRTPSRWGQAKSSFSRSDGTKTTKPGFSSQRAARDARRRLVEQVERGEVRHTKETFGAYWSRWLTHRRPYLEPGTWSGYEIHGRKRLVPAFGSVSLGDVNVDAVRAFASELSEAAGVGDLAIKTANNVLGTLAICLNDAVKDGLIVANPALLVGRLPPAHIERDYLRLEEIPRYLDCCSDLYRPLALGPISTERNRSPALVLLRRRREIVIECRSARRKRPGSAEAVRIRVYGAPLVQMFGMPRCRSMGGGAHAAPTPGSRAAARLVRRPPRGRSVEGVVVGRTVEACGSECSFWANPIVGPRPRWRVHSCPNDHAARRRGTSARRRNRSRRRAGPRDRVRGKAVARR